MSTPTWRVLTEDELAAQAADPQEIAWQAYLRRCAANARLHCPTCGRIVRSGHSDCRFTARWFTEYDCSKCGPGEVEH